MEDNEEEEEYHKLSEYFFSLDTTGLLFAMHDLGEKARWSRKFEKGTGWKDKSKWCAFHEDFIALRREISYLLSKGHLKEFLGKGKNKSKDHDRIPQRATSPPADAKVISFIYGGSDICGTSYSAANRNAKEAKTEKGDRPTKNSSLTEAKVISFDEGDRDDVKDPHHDGLVITLCITNHFIRRILIDGGSSVNIIQLEVLKSMGIPDSEIISKSSVLAGMIKEVKFPRWLANVVVVQKKNGKWRVCVDFTDLNKACPKDPFPLPHIDSMVDAIAGHEMLTFMDASSGFQQIQMEPSDQEDTAFMTPTGIYCYIAMPFGLKNAGATYQRLGNMMFKEKLRDTMEVYIDDMVVKSKKVEDHLRDLREAFDIWTSTT
ncbi:hypothetical protein L1987_60450 [Smallanthus sonchifolius]|uniref:Uncharacterized protein n=1 Tax=Smallanthus sonchifolius TaxID=185202 RepID=A0ACB9D886_9ASTR|nr:hypothetical protein L1987_60450 [Smallanthus sonchifolius]